MPFNLSWKALAGNDWVRGYKLSYMRKDGNWALLAEVDGKEANKFEVTDDQAAYKSYFEDQGTSVLTFKVEPIPTEASISVYRVPVVEGY